MHSSWNYLQFLPRARPIYFELQNIINYDYYDIYVQCIQEQFLVINLTLALQKDYILKLSDLSMQITSIQCIPVTCRREERERVNLKQNILKMSEIHQDKHQLICWHISEILGIKHPCTPASFLTCRAAGQQEEKEGST